MKASNFQDQLLERRTIRLIPANQQPDFFLILGRFVFPLQKSLLNGSHYFKRLSAEKNLTHVLTRNLDVKAVTFLLNSMRGIKECFPRTKELLDILDAALYLEYPIIQEHLAADISNHFDDYGFFLLLKVAEKLNLEWLLKKLCKEILDLNFEQLNFNKIDLFQYDRKSFISVMRKHFKLKQTGIIKGLSKKQIRGVLNQYCQTSKSIILQKQIFCSEKEDEGLISLVETMKEELAEKALSPTRRRNKKNGYQVKFLSESLKKQESYSTNASSSKDIKADVNNLLSINSVMRLKSQKFMSEISEMKEHISQRQAEVEDQPQTAGRYARSSDKKIGLLEKQWELMEIKYSKIFGDFKQKLELEQIISQESQHGSDFGDLSISIQLGCLTEFKTF